MTVAADRAGDASITVVPSEIARGIYIENPPGAEGLKLMHLLIAKAAGSMADDVRHDLRLADIKKIEGMRNHTRATLRKLFIELAGAVMFYDDPNMGCELIGGFLDRAKLDYRHEVSDNLVVSWWFGGAFREMAEKSCHWAIMDRQTIFALSSKYSILLFQHIASLVNLDRVESKEFTVHELRATMGIPEGKVARFANLNRDVLQPAIAEINQISRLTLTATPKKVGRTIVSVEIGWKSKSDPTSAKRELEASKVGRKVRREGTAETITDAPTVMLRFPDDGIRFTPWEDMAREHLPEPRRDFDQVATDFRSWAQREGKPLNGPQVVGMFIGFCKKQKPA